MTADQIVLQHRKLSAMREGLERDVYLTIQQVMKLLHASRPVVEAIPFEILPFINLTPGSPRAHRRYDPVDVNLALRVLLPRYQEAKAHGKGNAFLQELRAVRKKREEEILAQLRPGVAP